MTSWTRPVAHRRPFIASIRPLHSTGVRPSIHDAAASERASEQAYEVQRLSSERSIHRLVTYVATTTFYSTLMLLQLLLLLLLLLVSVPPSSSRPSISIPPSHDAHDCLIYSAVDNRQRRHSLTTLFHSLFASLRPVDWMNKKQNFDVSTDNNLLSSHC